MVKSTFEPSLQLIDKHKNKNIKKSNQCAT